MDITRLANCPLFEGVAPSDLDQALAALSPRPRSCGKNQLLLAQGEKVPGIGLLVEGTALVVMDDFWGKRSVITPISAGELFCEAFACSGVTELPVSVTATTNVKALFFSCEKFFEPKAVSSLLHTMCANLLRIVARRNLTLLRTNSLLARRTIRERVLGCLSSLAQEKGKNDITLPMNRQEMADFLAVDRTALSAELSRMRADGLIDFAKNRFRLLKNDAAR